MGPDGGFVCGETFGVVSMSVLFFSVVVGLFGGGGECLPLRGECLHCLAHGGGGAEGSFDGAEVVGLVEHEGGADSLGWRHGCAVVMVVVVVVVVVWKIESERRRLKLEKHDVEVVVGGFHWK